MSKLRPTLSDAKPGTFSPKGGTAYLMILNAVRDQHGLIHGKLDTADGCEHCAIGSYFACNSKVALGDEIIDEVAAVNDSAPGLTKRQRKQMVMRWLRWKLQSLGMPTAGRQARLVNVAKVATAS